MEEFLSVQGEGFHTGKPAYFLRTGGCDVGCEYCDEKEAWSLGSYSLSKVDDIIKRILKSKIKSVVVTGGEPLMYDLNYLCGQLKKHDIKTFLETSGTHALSGIWDWICLSPKATCPPLKNIYNRADELKVIIGSATDFKWAEQNAVVVKKGCMLFLQPEWSKRKKILPAIVSYVLKNPKWRISVQTHKYIGIP